MKFNLVSVGDQQNITVFVDGEMYVANQDHPNFKAIVAAAVENADDVDVAGLFDVSKAVAERFQTLSERVSVANGRVYFDGDEVDNALTRQIVRFMDEGVEDFKPLVNFFEKVSLNPQVHSREQLYNWLSKHDFTITPSGDLVGYKGVRKQADGSLVSISHGPAVVDGVAVNGAVPNEVGSVVELARSAVHHDPAVGCSTGLHVGTYQYANDFAQGALLEVHVNPRDVVSVPTDCNWQKVRCCRYTVVKVIDAPYTTAVLDDDDVYDDGYGNDEDDYDFLCEDCGEASEACCYDTVCDECGMDREDEDASVTAAIDSLRTSTVWDTRNNYMKQERYPAGTVIDGVNVSGRFIPKNP